MKEVRLVCATERYAPNTGKHYECGPELLCVVTLTPADLSRLMILRSAASLVDDVFLGQVGLDRSIRLTHPVEGCPWKTAWYDADLTAIPRLGVDEGFFLCPEGLRPPPSAGPEVAEMALAANDRGVYWRARLDFPDGSGYELAETPVLVWAEVRALASGDLSVLAELPNEDEADG